jgi:site-specific DNA-methyltransferase (adenine-specific)
VTDPVIIGDCTLYLGDCREILPTLGKVDAVVTDPPYGIDFMRYESHADDPGTYPNLMRDVISHVERLRGEGPAVFWQGMPTADRWHEWFPKGYRLFAACKSFVQYRPIAVQFSWDPVVFWGRPRGLSSVTNKDWHVQTIAPFGAGRPSIAHPCPRPLEQVQYVVTCFTMPADTILDPFMGSGTAGVACVKLGRKFIGIEIEPRYFDIACRRIEEATKQPDMFIECPSPQKQETML